jgi:hypothetical protein
MPDVNISTQHSAHYHQLTALSAQADTAVAEAGLDPLLGEPIKCPPDLVRVRTRVAWPARPGRRTRRTGPVPRP